MARKNMDFSPPLIVEMPPVDIPNRPISPWMRLAHISDYPTESATHQALLRYLHDFEIVLPLKGRTWIYCQSLNQSVDIQVGELAFFPPGFVHGWANEPGQHLAIHFDLHARPEMKAYHRAYQMIQRIEAPPVERSPGKQLPCFLLRFDPNDPLDDQEIVQNFSAAGIKIPLVKPLRQPALWRERLIPLTEQWSLRRHGDLPRRLEFSETVAWALRTVADDAAHAFGSVDTSGVQMLTRFLIESGSTLENQPSIAELARRFGMGQTSFRDAFLKAAGCSPRVYLEERRIAKAERLLIESDRKVSDVARQVGYSDPYHFSRAFKRVTGLSPREYRSIRANLDRPIAPEI